MIRVLAAWLACVLLLGSVGNAAEPATVLQRGINITNWFRFPPSRDPPALRDYLDDAAIRDLRRAGFTFVRLPIQPDMLTIPGVAPIIINAITRLQRHGLAVVVALHPNDWHLETDPGDRIRLLAFWRTLAPLLRRLDPALTIPEVLNEPVFADQPGAWADLQHQALLEIRDILPLNTMVLTGAKWGSIAGLLALTPEPDPNAVYSFHFYDPAELTALGAYRAGLDSAAMARLPFPISDVVTCQATAATANDPATADLMRFYCAQHWEAAKLATLIAAAGDWARRNHRFVLAGEFGASQRLNMPSRLAWLAAVREACEHQAIGWALWGYDDSMGFALRPPTGQHRLDADLMRALGLTLPAAQ